MSPRRILPRLLRRIAGAAVIAIFADFVIALLARWNVRREQKKRSWLGDRLYSESTGQGEPAIVALAGLQGSTRYWNHAFDGLEDQRRVVYLDALGFGRSPWPDRAGLEEQLGALDRTLKALGIAAPVIFLAHSFGTVLAAHFAARFPDRVRGLILLGTPVYDDAEDARRRIRDMSPMAAAFSLNPFLARESCNLVCAARPLIKSLVHTVRPDLRQGVAEDALLHHWPSIRGAMEILQKHPIEIALRRYGGATTFVHGTADTITPLARIRLLAAEIGAQVEVVDGGHHSYLQHRDQIISLICREKS